VAIDYGAIEAAIAAWLSTATGLPSADGAGLVARIIARNDKQPQPPLPYLTFTIPIAQQMDGPDEIRKAFPPGAAAGQEVVPTVIGNREFVVSVQCFTLATVGGADSEGNYPARHYVSKAQTALALPSVRAQLRAAGLGFVGIEGVADFSARLGPAGQGRASLDVRFRVADSITDVPYGFIATVNPTGHLS
jgi:hypothetical protein